MTWWQHALLALGVGLPTLVWCAALVAVVRTMRAIQPLEALPSEGEAWPQLSIIAPACNEEASIEGALRSILQSAYPAVEVIAVNDRSTDRTPELMDALAREDARLKVVHIDTLPEGWLGKLNAMAQGIAQARGEWLLLADADVHFSERALQRAVRYAQDRKLDYLSVVPDVAPAGLWADAVFNSAGVMMCLGARPWAVREVESSAILGTGAMMMVRREAYEAGPGLEWMRLEVADDQAVCLLIKRHGGRCDIVNARGEVRLQWYDDFREMQAKMQKNFYGIMARFSLARALALSVGVLWVTLAPLMFWAPWLGVWRWVALAGLVAWTLASWLYNRWVRRPTIPALMPWLGMLLTVYLILRSSWIGHRLGGISWRGTLYPSALLRDAQRVKL